MSKMPGKFLPLIILFSSMISGCSTIFSHLTYDFSVSENDKRVNFEAGAEDIAKYVSELLSEKVAFIEDNTYVRFKSKEEIKVYVFNTKEHYAAFSNASSLTRGSSSTDGVYLSPETGKSSADINKILVHELSHVHLRQHIGTWQYITNIPGWFHEGLAVVISNGGGAEGVSDNDAIQSINSGKHFVPTVSGSIFGHKYASDYHLKPRMYYKQAGLFVNYLIRLNGDSFKKSYIDLSRKESFNLVWKKYYGKTIPELWNQFLISVKV